MQSGSALEPAPTRVASIDVLRGAVMALMAIDHVRVFAAVPAGGPTAGVFFTRWITHFCAPVFVFLAGTSAYLYGRKHADLTKHLLLRGLLLVALELTLVRAGWTFNLDVRHQMAGVIWAIGWSMVVLAGLVKLPRLALLAFGALVVAGHNAFANTSWVQELGQGPWSGAWKILYHGFLSGPIEFGEGGPTLMVLYSLVPWVGVMALGHAFGSSLELEAGRRERLWLALGLGATASFVILRGFELYGDPRSWRAAAEGPRALPPLLAFLETSKYPASLQFLLMTLGPALAVLPWLERASGLVVRWLALFGRVPLFFYLIHLPVIHALALLVSFARDGRVTPWLFESHPMGAGQAPEDYRWSLLLLYTVWAVAMGVLFVACRWFAELKVRHGGGWLRWF